VKPAGVCCATARPAKSSEEVKIGKCIVVMFYERPQKLKF
jgi:ribosomal 50S subunit-recycling heat shock protein